MTVTTNSPERYLLVQLDILHYLQGKRKVPQEDVNTQEPNDAKVTKHAI